MVTAQIARAYLKKDRDRPVRGGNPWIFSQAIGRIEPAEVEPGAQCEVFDAGGDLIGLGYVNPATTIAIRMLAWGETPPLEELIERRLRGAIDARRAITRPDTDSYRLVNGDGDGLSGVVVDRYGDVLVVQLLTAGADRMRDLSVSALARLLQPRAILERSHGAVRKQEGLEDRSAALVGEDLAEAIVKENGIRFIA
ncbi:MAG TPA: hypothetical protein VGR40_07565, partial [Candidatus Binatus sp.]|nr:hypothetical protein [Candidatus Binatus sp.]